jgi:hypothetical protein
MPFAFARRPLYSFDNIDIIKYVHSGPSITLGRIRVISLGV